MTDQLDKFTATAREAECDEREAAFEDKLRRIAKAKSAVDDAPKDQRRKP
jgi:hypothetical protein